MHAAGSHAGPLRDAVHRLKYRGERGIAVELGCLGAERVAVDLALGVALDVIVPVTLHPTRVAMRGYDQVRLLADVVAERAGLPVAHAVRRIRAGSPQVRLDRAACEANVRGAFVSVVGGLRGARVALIDDVTTTGATLRAAAAAAHGGGASSVVAYVIAVDD